MLQAVLLWAKLTPDDVTVQVGSAIDLGNKFHIPIDDAGRMRVDFGAPFSSLGLSDDLAFSSEQKLEAGLKPPFPIDRITGNIVLLSRTDSAARTIPLAARRDGSPGEFFAAAIATIQSQSFIRPAPAWATYAVIAVFMLLSFRVPRMKKMKTIVLGGFVSVAVYMLHRLGCLSPAGCCGSQVSFPSASSRCACSSASLPPPDSSRKAHAFSGDS